MSQGRIYTSTMDALLGQSVDRLEEELKRKKDYDNASGERGALPNGPCRYCRRTGGVQFRIDDSPRGRSESQVVRCDNCGRDWEASPLA